MRLPGVVIRPIAAVLAVTTLGCYSYAPLDEGAPEAGQEVRIEVGEAMGEPARTYTGRIMQVNTQTLVLSRAVARSPSRQGTVSGDQIVRIPRSRVRSVERQEISFWKSAGLIAAGGAAASLGLAALAGTFESDVDGNTGDDRDTGEASISVPIPFP